MKHAATLPAPTGPSLADFPGAEIVGGAIILKGRNMGTLVAGDRVEVSPLGQLYIDGSAETMSPPEVQVITTVPDPVPTGVIDPSKMAAVEPRAKAAVRKRKQAQASVDAMNSPTAEEEADFVAADAAPAGGPEQPPNMGTGGDPVEEPAP
jgi:hypothetical protein